MHINAKIQQGIEESQGRSQAKQANEEGAARNNGGTRCKPNDGICHVVHHVVQSDAPDAVIW